MQSKNGKLLVLYTLFHGEPALFAWRDVPKASLSDQSEFKIHHSKLTLMLPSMRDTFTPDHFDKGQKDDPQIQQKGSLPQVPFVKLDLDRDRQFIPAVDLCPAGQAGREMVDPFFGPQGNQVILIKESRTRTDNAHIAGQDAPQLWQFIQAGFAQELADRSQPLIRIPQQVGGHGRGIGAHGAEFWHPEDAVLPAHPVGPVQHRPG